MQIKITIITYRINNLIQIFRTGETLTQILGLQADNSQQQVAVHQDQARSITTGSASISSQESSPMKKEPTAVQKTDLENNEGKFCFTDIDW